MSNKLVICLVVIIFIAALTRLLFLGEFPNGFTGDEAQQGYSAYSILQTGRDEWGEFLPLNPRGFGDFKPPLQTYLMIPSIAIFGLTVEAVRLPAALVGVLTILVVFFLASELTDSKKIAFWSAFFLAINPWHIQLSRTAFEGGIGVFFFSLGLLFFLKGFKKQLYFILSALVWGLTFYSYHSHKLFLMLFLISLAAVFRKKLISKKMATSLAILAILLVPLLTNFKASLARASDVGIISEQVLNGYFEDKPGTNLGSWDRIFDNKFFFVSEVFLNNYLSYYSPTFYFTGQRSDGTYLNFPKFPLIYPVEIFAWIIAGWLIFSNKVQGKKIFLIWFALAAIPASLATGSLNANRAVTFLPLTAILSGIGMSWIADRFHRNAVILGLIIFGVYLALFGHFYIYQLPYKPIDNLRFGYDQTFKKIMDISGEYGEIIISKGFTEPQIFVAFYGKVNPSEYQKASADWLRYEKANKPYVDQLESWNLGKFKFEDINWDKKDSQRQKSLIVGKPEDFPGDVPSLLNISRPDGKVIFKLVETLNYE